MQISLLGGFPSARGSFEVTFLNQKRFVHFLDGTGFFADGRSNGTEADRTAFELFYDRGKYPVVHLVQPVLIHVQRGQRQVSNLERNGSVSFDLREVADATQQRVGDTRGAATPSGDLVRGVFLHRRAQDIGAALQDALKQRGRIIFQSGCYSEAGTQRRGQ